MWCAKEQPIYNMPLKTSQEAFDKAGKMERNAPQQRKCRWAEDQWDTCNGWRWIVRFNITSGRSSITISLPNKC